MILQIISNLVILWFYDSKCTELTYLLIYSGYFPKKIQCEPQQHPRFSCSVFLGKAWWFSSVQECGVLIQPYVILVTASVPLLLQGGHQKIPLCQRLSSQTLRYLTDCDTGTAITEAYGASVSTSGHLRATIPAIIASSGTKCRFIGHIQLLLPLVSSCCSRCQFLLCVSHP